MLLSILLLFAEAGSLLVFRIVASLLMSVFSAIIYIRKPGLKSLLHYLQGAAASVIAIYLAWLIFRIWASDARPSSFAFTMGLLNLLMVLSNRDTDSKEKGMFADSIGGLLGSIAIWVTGIEHYTIS